MKDWGTFAVVVVFLLAAGLAAMAFLLVALEGFG